MVVSAPAPDASVIQVAPSSPTVAVPTAAPTAADAQADAGKSALQDIVVTARRQSESLQRTPVSVTAFTGADLYKRSITRASDLQSSEEHTSELQSLMRISYAVFCLKKK